MAHGNDTSGRGSRGSRPDGHGASGWRGGNRARRNSRNISRLPECAQVEHFKLWETRFPPECLGQSSRSPTRQQNQGMDQSLRIDDLQHAQNTSFTSRLGSRRSDGSGGASFRCLRNSMRGRKRFGESEPEVNNEIKACSGDINSQGKEPTRTAGITKKSWKLNRSGMETGPSCSQERTRNRQCDTSGKEEEMFHTQSLSSQEKEIQAKSRLIHLRNMVYGTYSGVSRLYINEKSANIRGEFENVNASQKSKVMRSSKEYTPFQHRVTLAAKKSPSEQKRYGHRAQGPLHSALGKRRYEAQPSLRVRESESSVKRRRTKEISRDEQDVSYGNIWRGFPSLQRSKVSSVMHTDGLQQPCTSHTLTNNESSTEGTAGEIVLSASERSALSALIDESIESSLRKSVSRLEGEKEMLLWKRAMYSTRIAGKSAFIDSRTGSCSSPLCKWCRGSSVQDVNDVGSSAEETLINFKIDCLKSFSSMFSRANT